MELDGKNPTEHAALAEIAATVQHLKQSVLPAMNNRQVQLAVYLLEMVLVAVDKENAADIEVLKGE